MEKSLCAHAPYRLYRVRKDKEGTKYEPIRDYIHDEDALIDAYRQPGGGRFLVTGPMGNLASIQVTGPEHEEMGAALTEDTVLDLALANAG